jgi:hypothetical protein
LLVAELDDEEVAGFNLSEVAASAQLKAFYLLPSQTGNYDLYIVYVIGIIYHPGAYSI